jgi:hypothetical protein
MTPLQHLSSRPLIAVSCERGYLSAEKLVGSMK